MKRLIKLLMIAVILTAILGVSVSAAQSGNCGENITWTLDDNGTLTITGTGDLENTGFPWAIESKFKTIVIGEGITAVGDYVFKGCKNLTDVSLPSTITRIGEQAFRNCPMLATINLPDAVTSIGFYAFCDCTNLTIQSLPKSLKEIGDSAFRYCESITDIALPEGLTSIDQWAFNKCTGLKNLSIPSTLSEIERSVFQECTSLETVTFAEGLTYLPHNTFYKCSSLKQVELPDSVTVIGLSAFYNCTSLESIRLSPYTTVIESTAFSGDALTEITLPSTLQIIGGSAFSSCKNLYIDASTLPASLEEIGPTAFSSTKLSGTLTVHAALKSIGASAFSSTALTSVVVEDGVTELPSNLFTMSHSITSISLPASLTVINEPAFGSLDALETITISKDNPVYYFENHNLYQRLEDGTRKLVRYYGEELESYTIPTDGTVLGDYAYIDADQIIFPDGIEKVNITQSMFSGAKEYVIPDSVTEISINLGDYINNYSRTIACNYGSYAYEYAIVNGFGICLTGDSTGTLTAYGKYGTGYNCVWVLDKDGVLTLEGVWGSGSNSNSDWADYKDQVKAIVYKCKSKNNTVLVPSASGYPELTSVKILTDANEVILGSYLNCKKLEEFVFGNVVTINGANFSGCTSLTSITLPETLTTIGDNAFMNSGLTEVYIPASVTSIAESAFTYCENLESFTVSPDNPNYASENGALLSKDKTRLILCPFNLPENTFTVPDGVTVIGECVFNHDIRKYIIPESVTTLENLDFSGNIHITLIVLNPGEITINKESIWGNIDIYGYTGSGIEAFASSNEYCTFHAFGAPETCSHVWDSGTVTTPAACTTDGVLTITCRITTCKSTKTEAIPATGHYYGSIQDVPATCEEDGVHIEYCTNTGCVHKVEEIYPKTGHTYEEPEITEPSCNNAGFKFYKCTNKGCEYYYNEEIKELGHDFDGADWVVVSELSCDTEYLAYQYCKRDGCGIYIEDKKKPTGHLLSDQEPEYIVKPTCTEDGELKYICKNEHCRDGYYIEYVPALGHGFKGWYVDSEEYDKETGTWSGKEKQTCYLCGESEIREIDYQSHNYGEWVVETKSTCNLNGKEIRYCQDEGCKEVLVRLIPTLEHSYTETWETYNVTCQSDGEERLVCDYGCGNYKEARPVPKIDHVYTRTVIITPATAEHDGELRKYCRFDADVGCGAYITEVIPKLKTETGSCGENLTWVLTTDGVFTLSGKGDMPEMEIKKTPWYDLKQRIIAIVIEDGVTSISAHAFYETSNAKYADIPASVTKISKSAFESCKNLTIRGYKNSAAESHAKDYNIKFEAVKCSHSWSEWKTDESGKATRTCQITVCGAEETRQVETKTLESGVSAEVYSDPDSGEVTVVIDETSLNTIFENTSADSDTLSIDLSEVKGSTNSGAEITFPKESIKKAAEMAADENNSVSSMTVQTSGGSVALDTGVLAALAQSDADVSLQLTVISGSDTKEITNHMNTVQAAELESYLKDNETQLLGAFNIELGDLHELNGTAEISIKPTLPENCNLEYLAVLHFDEITGKNEVLTSKDGKVAYDSETGELTVTLDHFSPFVLVYEEPVIMGDMNGDNKADEKDAELIIKHFAGQTVELNLSRADLDGSGSVSRSEAMIVLRYIAEWPGYADRVNNQTGSK